MKIALDVSSAARPDATGVAMYIRRLVPALLRQGPQHGFTAVTRASRIKNILHKAPVEGPNLQHKLMLEGLHPIFARSTDVFHGLDARLPGRWMKAKTVVTIHDVFSALQSTEFATPEFRAMKRKRYDSLVERADRIICVSHACKRDVLETLKPDPAKLRVVYEAGGEGFAPRSADEITAARTKYGLEKPYILFVGSINKRKNVPAQVEAFCKAKRETKADVVLAVAGRMGYGSEQIQETLKRMDCADAVKMLGYVPNPDLAPLYSGARALLFCTLYEGFGIPAVEAFMCGCPVIGATVGSLPEIIADAGVLADPKDVDSIAQAIGKMMTDDALRNGCAAKGTERAKLFSWDTAAQECLAIYQELISK